MVFGCLAAGQRWIGAPDGSALLSATPLAVSVYSGLVWLALRRVPASARSAHPILLSLAVVMSVHHATHQYVLATPVLSTNPVLVALACAYFYTSRPWFLAALVVCFLSWWPAASVAGPFAPEWRHWTATLASGIALATAAFEARRRGLVRLESMRILAEQRGVEAEQALAQAEFANSDRLTMERAMHESQRRESLGVLAGGIAHDFNNLLTVIQGNVELAQLESDLSEGVEENLATIASTADRAARLTHQLLVYSGRAKPRIATVDLGERIHGTVALFRSLLRPNVDLTLHGKAGRVPVEADPALLDQVIINFVQNSIEACSPEGGRIDVRWGEWPALEAGGVSTHAFIEVADTGCGMDDATRRRIFEPFYSTKAEGTGLGLAAVKGIADSHGAEVEADSQPGVGTVLRFIMPLGDQRPAARAESPPVAPRITRPVLIVDDQHGVRRVARGHLDSAGYGVLEAGSAEEAFEAVDALAAPLGAALIDLTMPGASGYDVAAAMRKRDPNLPIVVMSGFDRHDSLRNREPVDPLHFLQKPFSRSELLAALERAVEGDP